MCNITFYGNSFMVEKENYVTMRWFAIIFIVILIAVLPAGCSVPKSVYMFPPEPVYSPADDPEANYGSENDLYPGIYLRWGLEMQ